MNNSTTPLPIRYIVWETTAGGDRVVALGESARLEDVNAIVAAYAPDAVMYDHPQVSAKLAPAGSCWNWKSRVWRYGAEAFAEGTRRYNNVEALHVGELR